jgi:hypothetical protein
MDADPRTERVDPEGAGRVWWVDAAVLGGVALLLRVPALVASRTLVYDDASFGLSALAMRHGELPFRDIFSSQGPLFLPLVFLGDLVGLRGAHAPRVLSVVAGVVVTVATYAAARRLTGRAPAVIAALLVTTSGSVLWVTAPVNADGPAMAAAVVALALALRYRSRPTTATVVGIGLAAGAVLSIKLVAAPVLVPVGILLLSRRRARDVALAAGTAAALYLVLAVPWGLGDVVDQSFRYHRDSAREMSYGAAARKVVSTLLDRDLLVVVAAALAGATALVHRFGPGRAPDGTTRPDDAPAAPPGPGRGAAAALLGAWAVSQFALLVWEPALFRPHVAQLVPALALLAALAIPPWPVLAVAMVVATPFWGVTNRSILWPDADEPRWRRALLADLRELPGDAVVIGDDPGAAWQTGRRVPGFLADPSFKRIESGAIIETTIVRAARDPHVCAVFATSTRHFLRFDDLGVRLGREGFRAVPLPGGRVLWLRPRCR